MAPAAGRAAEQNWGMLQPLNLSQVIGRDLEMLARAGIELVQRQAPCQQLLTGKLQAQDRLCEIGRTSARCTWRTGCDQGAGAWARGHLAHSFTSL
ncbi:hypothetical protein WJ84_01670 [Burkholderia ubonensis]|nr:hypothetical protein WJ84_01670 [Burkholderia ubonensis]